MLFWHLDQTHTFNNNLDDGEMIISHLMFELPYKATAYRKSRARDLYVGPGTRDLWVRPGT